MSDILISQAEADRLINLEKVRVDDKPYQYPQISGYLSIPLLSKDGREKFILDIRLGHIAVKKITYQNRSRKSIILVRLDTKSTHTNPDGQTIKGSHFHLYREGFADKWAIPVPDSFTNLQDLLLTLDEFMDYCKIVEQPIIQGSSV
jgi:hypothetical protein